MIVWWKWTAVVAMASGLAATVGAANADDACPDHTITMVVPFPPGGAADIVARPMADAMGRVLKQAVVILNRRGAGGGIGMANAAKASLQVQGTEVQYQDEPAFRTFVDGDAKVMTEVVRRIGKVE